MIQWITKYRGPGQHQLGRVDVCSLGCINVWKFWSTRTWVKTIKYILAMSDCSTLVFTHQSSLFNFLRIHDYCYDPISEADIFSQINLTEISTFITIISITYNKG